METDPDVIDAYRKAMRRHTSRKLFVQNRARMGGIITNLLGNLAVLKRKKTAVRDLKPDNVFIAGDLSGEPFLLETPEKYSIGLIDFETSVVFYQGSGDDIPQPMLAGTPSYATVSHLFPNDFLSAMYPSLARILHLQDWHAVSTMIYNVVTGQQLGLETGRLMPMMIRDMKAAQEKNVSRNDIYRRYTLVFWTAAAGEFGRKTGLHQKVLADVRVQIPKSAKEMLSEEIGISKTAIWEWMKVLLKNPSVSLTQKDIDGISNASGEKLVQWRNRWEKGANEKGLPEAARKKVLGVLNGLVKLKRDRERMETFLDRLGVPKPIVQADDLLGVMFNTVLYGMHKPEWGVITGEPAAPTAGAPSAHDPGCRGGLRKNHGPRLRRQADRTSAIKSRNILK